MASFLYGIIAIIYMGLFVVIQIIELFCTLTYICFNFDAVCVLSQVLGWFCSQPGNLDKLKKRWSVLLKEFV